jgi:hypothetical protein
MPECGAQCTARLSLEKFLFLLYINDFTENYQRAKLVLIGDDTNLLITRKYEFDL